MIGSCWFLRAECCTCHLSLSLSLVRACVIEKRSKNNLQTPRAGTFVNTVLVYIRCLFPTKVDSSNKTWCELYKPRKVQPPLRGCFLDPIGSRARLGCPPNVEDRNAASQESRGEALFVAVADRFAWSYCTVPPKSKGPQPFPSQVHMCVSKLVLYLVFAMCVLMSVAVVGQAQFFGNLICKAHRHPTVSVRCRTSRPIFTATGQHRGWFGTRSWTNSFARLAVQIMSKNTPTACTTLPISTKRMSLIIVV